jgi:bifunctional non-homologous end joining protein LigD
VTAMAIQISKKRIVRSPKTLPAKIEPMLATSGELPVDQAGYTFEYKWDGVRAIGFFQNGGYRILARSGTDITARYPELQHLADAVGSRNVILDSEIVALDESSRPSFGQLQHRMHLTDAKMITRLSKTEPVFCVLFDLLYLDGRSLLDQPYQRRRQLLEDLTLMGDVWQVTPAHVGEGTAMLASARQNQLEGIVAKRLDSSYQPGQRSSDWIKIKIVQRQEFVVAGWMPERTGTEDRIGSILVGYYDCNRKLRYAGKVGTGLSAKDHLLLLRRLAGGRKMSSPVSSPFADPVPRGAIFTGKPAVAEIEYRRWPAGGLLQQAVYKGLRTDKPAKDVVRETPQ